MSVREGAYYSTTSVNEIYRLAALFPQLLILIQKHAPLGPRKISVTFMIQNTLAVVNFINNKGTALR